MNFIQRFFSKRRFKSKSLGDVALMYIKSEREINSMHNFIHENYRDCGDLNIGPSKKILKRYRLRSIGHVGLAWFLMEKYFEGKITIQE